MGFAMQSLFIGVGAVVADMLPYMLKNWFGVTSDTDGANGIPTNVKISFYLGAAAFLGAVLWTVISTGEYPPADMEAFRRKKSERSGLISVLREVADAMVKMPGTMKRLALVQFFTWLGLFCMWLHFSNAVPVVFGTADPNSDLFKRGAEWAGVCYAVKDAVTFVAAFALMAASRTMARRHIHGICLSLGGLGLLAVGLIHG
jgi:maltose/moltooligosaccharide transporter